MAYTTINKHTDYFNTKLYTGTGSNQAITGVGHQPDLIWWKCRNSAKNNGIMDSVRGNTKRIITNSANAESTNTDYVQSFDSDGFTAGSNGNMNSSGDTFCSWNWKAGTTGSGNTGGSGTYKSYTYSVNTTAGFSIVYYTGNGTAGHTIPHHLGVVPSLIILKSISASEHWQMYHHKIGATKYLEMSTTAAEASNTNRWHNTTPTSSVFSLGNHTSVNTDGTTYIAYCFAEKTGYSKFGSYTGNGNADGTFIYTGFKPSYVLIKQINETRDWLVMDNKRLGYNPNNYDLHPSGSDTEDTNARLDLLSNGFKQRVTSSANNKSGGTFIYMAFGQSLVGSNNIPCTAR